LKSREAGEERDGPVRPDGRLYGAGRLRRRSRSGCHGHLPKEMSWELSCACETEMRKGDESLGSRIEGR
jgi:hypothetical protein